MSKFVRSLTAIVAFVVAGVAFAAGMDQLVSSRLARDHSHSLKNLLNVYLLDVYDFDSGALDRNRSH